MKNSPPQHIVTKIATGRDLIKTHLCAVQFFLLNFLISLYFQCLESLIKDVSWHQFIIDLVLMSNVNEIRSTATDQFLLIATRCSGEQHPIRFFITLLFTQVGLIDIYLLKLMKFNKTHWQDQIIM